MGIVLLGVVESCLDIDNFSYLGMNKIDFKYLGIILNDVNYYLVREFNNLDLTLKGFNF